MDKIELSRLLQAVAAELSQMAELAADLDDLIAGGAEIAPARAQGADRLRQLLEELAGLSAALAEASPMGTAVAPEPTLGVLRLDSLADRLVARLNGQSPAALSDQTGEAELF